MTDNLAEVELQPKLSKAVPIMNSLSNLGQLQQEASGILSVANDSVKAEPKSYKFTHQAGKLDNYFLKNISKKRYLSEINEAIRDLRDPEHLSSVSFVPKELLQKESLNGFEEVLKRRSLYISSVENFDERKSSAINLVSSADAFFAYIDIYCDKNKKITIDKVIADNRYQELVSLFSKAGGVALDMIGNVPTGSDEYKKGISDAGIPAKKNSDIYLVEHVGQDKLEMFNAKHKTDDDIKALIEKYLSSPDEMDSDEKMIISLKLRLANHTWKIGQIEREADGERGDKSRIARPIFRLFDAIRFIKKEQDLVEELKKDWNHVK